MTALEKIRAWIAAFPEFNIQDSFQVEDTDRISAIGDGAIPAGLVELERRQDVLGNTTVANQYNFCIYRVLSKPQGEEATPALDTGWLMPFREWVQEQSVGGLVPSFGDPGLGRETVSVGPGRLFRDSGDGAATFLVTLTINFKRRYEV